MTTPTPKALAWADRQVGRLAVLLAIIGAVATLALMLITVAAVTWRYGLNDPIFGIEDLSVVTLTLVAGASVAYGARHGAHISIDVLTNLLGERVSRYTDLVMRLLVVGIAGLAAFALFDKACGIEKACITNNFSIEHTAFYYFLGICMAVYALHVLLQLLIAFAQFRHDSADGIAG